MKTIKKTVITLLVLFMGAIIITSCSKENDTNKNVSQNAKVSAFLKSYYSKDFELGESIKTKIKRKANPLAKSEEVEDVKITEVLVGDDIRARGYVITDKTTNVFLYFVDVDRIDYKMTTIDIDINDVTVLKDINEMDKYISSNEFDLIKVSQDYLLELNSGQSPKPFLRWAYEQGPCGEAGDGLAYVYHNHYFLGIRVAHIQQFSIADDTQPLIEPCGWR